MGDLQEELQGGSSLRIADQEGELREEEEEEDNPGPWTPSEDSPGPWASSPVPQSSGWEPGGSSSLRSTESMEDNPSFSSDQNYMTQNISKHTSISAISLTDKKSQ